MTFDAIGAGYTMRIKRGPEIARVIANHPVMSSVSEYNDVSDSLVIDKKVTWEQLEQAEVVNLLVHELRQDHGVVLAYIRSQREKGV